MSVVIIGQNEARNTSFRVELKANYTDESAEHPLACKVHFTEELTWTLTPTQTMYMSFSEFQSQIHLLTQNDETNSFTFSIPGFPELNVSWATLQDISTQDYISECLEVYKSFKYTL